MRDPVKYPAEMTRITAKKDKNAFRVDVLHLKNIVFLFMPF